MPNIVTCSVIGAGQRGRIYSNYAKTSPNELKIVAVAEPNDANRDLLVNTHNIPKENIFKNSKDLLKQPKMSDMVIIATQDAQHFEDAMAAIDKRYDILLEKPMAISAEQCLTIRNSAKEKGVSVSICHVLRYTPFFNKVKQIIDSGAIGDVVSVQAMECVGYYHMAHSYVRGNWRNEKESSPMILAKSCHDLDIFNFILGKKVKKVSSFGSLKHFKEENAPKGAPKYCLDGCPKEQSCPYFAPAIYVGKNEWPTTVVSLDTSNESVLNALKSGPYGRCVYRCDNDVVDHQVVNIMYEDDVTVSFSMMAFTANAICRTIRVMGTMGEFEGDDDSGIIKHTDFLTGHITTYSIGHHDGHGGGDVNIMKDLLIARLGSNHSTKSGIDASTDSHIMAFAAEEARKKDKVIDIEDFRKTIKLLK